MLNNQKVTAIIPVRGGSKGIPRKNLYKLGNDTLLERAIKIGLLCDHIDKVIVSTDDIEMYDIAKVYGVNETSLRPNYLATDGAKTIDVIKDSLNKNNIIEGMVLLLQVTNATRTLSDLNSFFNEFQKSSNEFDSSVSLVSFDHPHPNKIQVIKDGYVRSYLGNESMVSRQSLPKVYALNGAFYLANIDSIYANNSFFSQYTLPFIMKDIKSINLDNIHDLYLLESLIKNKIITIEEYNIA